MAVIAFLLGFVGYLPLGNINLTVVQLSVSENKNHVQRFIFFAALMEFVYCFFCLYGMELLMKKVQLMTWLNWSAVVLFALLGLISFFYNESDEINAGSNHHWKRGVFVAIFNPLQIPFWLVWGVYVFENGWLQKNISGIALFAFCCSIGTIAVLYFYAMAGKKMVEKLNITRTFLSRFVGVVMLLLAAYQTYHTLHA
jgi:threonine/homoserine/homoserine lactone efflux protein